MTVRLLNGKVNQRLKSDKASTSPKEPRKNKQLTAANDGSYLQIQDQIAVSTVPPTSQNFMSAATGQTILEMLNKFDALNQDLSKRMDRFECARSVSSTPITSPTVPLRGLRKGWPSPNKLQLAHSQFLTGCIWGRQKPTVSIRCYHI